MACSRKLTSGLLVIQEFLRFDSHKPTRREQSLQRRFGQSQHRRLHVPMHTKWATRWHAVEAALALRLKGLNITTDLMQVGKVVTGQQLQHHGQGLRATLIVLPAALQVL